MPKEITINVHDDIPDALRDQLVRQLERRAAPIVGNFADLNRLGAVAIAEHGPDETFRLNPGVDEEEAKLGAKRVLDEEEAAANFVADNSAGPDEDPASKDPVELDRDGKVTTAKSTAKDTDTTKASDANKAPLSTSSPTTESPGRFGRGNK